MIMRFWRLKMKTSELKKILEERDFQVEITDINPFEIEIWYEGTIRALVNRDIVCSLRIENTYEEMSGELRIFLFNVLCEYVNTPIKKRDDGKRYYIKHKWITYRNQMYLCCDDLADIYYLNDEPPVTGGITSKFTQEHINYIKSKYKTNLEDFIFVEAKDEDRRF